MEHPEARWRRRLIVNADDFGRSSSINHAVLQAHTGGILTTTSLMVNESACAEAVKQARDQPNLGVGLHLSLVCGQSALSPGQLRGLVDEHGKFSNNAAAAGIKYFARRGLRDQLRQEIAAQVERFHSTGLVLDHVNGHLHLHLHPVVFDLLMEHAVEWGIQRARLTRDPFRLNARLAEGRWAYRASHALAFHFLAQRSGRGMKSRGIKHADQVFGLLQNGKVDEAYVLALLEQLPRGDSELYSHPSLDQFKHELDALLSPRVKTRIQELDISLIRYQDL
jgi:chitin disaccharide deacetylase